MHDMGGDHVRKIDRLFENLLGHLHPPRLSSMGKCLAVPIATAAALVIQLVVLSEPTSAPFVFLFLAVAISAWFAGPLAGFIAVLLSVALANIVDHSYSTVWSPAPGRHMADILFVVSASGIAILCGSLRTTLLQAEAVGEQLRKSEQEHRSLFDNMREGLAYCAMRFEDGQPGDFKYLAVNPSFGRLTGLQDVVGRWVSEVIPGIREADPQLFEIYGRVASSGKPETFEMRVAALAMWFNISVYCPKPGHFVAVFDVITERKQLEEQLRQAQRMEAMGRLAGGVAHDFNNLLTAISGNLSLAMMNLGEQDGISEYLRDADHASSSAADLTRQLLAFSRKQIVEPRVFDLNDAIRSMHKMLSRVIGDHIDLQARPGSKLAPVKVDPGQFEQVLVNLAINAADAMPDGGKLTLETTNVELDENYCRTHPEVSPGDYVMLAVSDTGCGMSLEVICRCLEPFFTTKPQDKGTGLGLSTVYGIVKQARGSIEIYSEVGRGTTIKIYLPRAGEKTEQFSVSPPARSLSRGTETVLLVEDDPAVRDVALRVLRKFGYHVLHFTDAREALKAARDYPHQIHLLLTDVVMPGMNGRQLAEELLVTRPQLKVLYASGYTENVIVHHGALESGIQFIGKPYAAQSLAAKVREVLDAA